MQNLVVACDAGRRVDLQNILKHELCQVPLALALESGALRLREKAALMKEILNDVDCPNNMPVNAL